MIRVAIRVAIPALVLAATTACLEPIAPGDVEIGMVKLLIGSRGAEVDTIQVRATTRARATAFAKEGYDAGVTRFRFETSDPAVATVDSMGTVRGMGPGEAVITASVGDGPSGSARVVVLPSAIAYSIPVGSSPGATAFSTDFSRAYVAIAPDSIAIVDALGFFRIGAVGVRHAVGDIAATGTHVYATHPFADAVSVLSAGTNEVVGSLWVGVGPHGVVTSGNRAFVAARYDQRVVTVEGTTVGQGIPVGGEPTVLAASGDRTRLFAGVLRGSGWHLSFIDPQFPDTVSSVAMSGEPTSIAVNADGSRVWVLLASQGRVDAFDVSAAGAFSPAGSAAVGAGATGIAMRQVGPAFVIVSGEPVVVLDGAAMLPLEQIAGAGRGKVTVRPDGLFAFLSAPGLGAIHVIRM